MARLFFCKNTYIALQHKKLADFIKHEVETINFQIRFYKEMSQKKVVSKLTTESREETHKLTFGAMQYMRLLSF